MLFLRNTRGVLQKWLVHSSLSNRPSKPQLRALKALFKERILLHRNSINGFQILSMQTKILLKPIVKSHCYSTFSTIKCSILNKMTCYTLTSSLILVIWYHHSLRKSPFIAKIFASLQFFSHSQNVLVKVCICAKYLQA